MDKQSDRFMDTGSALAAWPLEKAISLALPRWAKLPLVIAAIPCCWITVVLSLGLFIAGFCAWAWEVAGHGNG